MRTLYEIDNDILTAVDGIYSAVDEVTGEITDEELLNSFYERLDALNMERDAKLEGVALYIKELGAEVEAIKAEAQRLTERRRKKEQQADRLKVWLGNALDGKKFETAKTCVSFRKTTSVNVLDLDALPAEYVAVKTELTPDKRKLKEALKNGVEIAGAELETRNSLTVR